MEMEEYVVKDLSEVELEDKVRRAPHLIEDGLKFVDHQRGTHRGPLDVLMVDASQALVVAELKVVTDEAMLWQGLDYYDYVCQNLAGLARSYQQYNVDPSQNPRLMLIAPDFPEALVRRCKWISDQVRISLFRYQRLILSDKKSETMVYVPVEIPKPPASVQEQISLEKHLAYIKDGNVRKLAQQFLDVVQGWDSKSVTLDVRQWGSSLRIGGRVFAYWEPRRAAIRISTLDLSKPGDWECLNVENEDALNTILAVTQKAFEAKKPSSSEKR